MNARLKIMFQRSIPNYSSEITSQASKALLGDRFQPYSFKKAILNKQINEINIFSGDL
jgi:hypothetical protein